MRPRSSLARGAIAVVLVSSLATAATAAMPRAVQEGPIANETEERRGARTDAVPVDARALDSNPDESSFGTLQEDGSYCGVTCFENH